MKVEIEVPDQEGALRMQWEPEPMITAEVRNGLIHIKANRDGLVSLARLFLTLAQPDVQAGRHWHLDDSGAFEPGSVELIVERI